MKHRAFSPRAWLSAGALLLVVVGVLSDLGGAVETWRRFIAWLNGALRLPPDSPLVRHELWLLPLLLLLALALVAFLRWAVEQAEPARAVRRSGGRQGVAGGDRVRDRYLSYLSADVENRLRSSIHRARFLDLGLNETQGATLPWHYEYFDPQAGQEVFGSFDAAFDRFGRRILLLGSPGSGKSTTLLHTALRLLAEARRDPAAPVPVLLNLASFDSPPEGRLDSRRRGGPPDQLATEEEAAKDRSFDRWLVEQLARLPVRGLGAVAEQWVQEARIALLLDGLDEVEEVRAGQLVHTLNFSFLRRYPDLTTVVCSRVIEYQRLTQDPEMRLRLDRAVTLQPLAGDQINAYLEAAGATALRDVLLGDRELYELAQTPLTLSIMTLAYGGLAPTDIPPNLPLAERRRHLFDTYIERMLQRAARREAGKLFDLDRGKDEPTRYSLKQVNRYLGWLAVRLSERMQTSFAAGNLPGLLNKKPVLDSTRFWTEQRQATLLYVSVLSLCVSSVLLEGSPLAWVGMAGPVIYLLCSPFHYDIDIVLGIILTIVLCCAVGLLTGAAFYFLTSALTGLLPRGTPWVAIGLLVAAGCYAVVFDWFYTSAARMRLAAFIAVMSWTVGGLLVVLLHWPVHLLWVLASGVVLGLYSVALDHEDGPGERWVRLRVGAVFLLIGGGVVGVGWLGARFLGSPTPAWIAATVAGAIGFLSALDPQDLEKSVIGSRVTLKIALGAVVGGLFKGAAGAAVGAALIPLSSALFGIAIWRAAADGFFQRCLLAVLSLHKEAPWQYQRFVVYATETLLLKKAGEEHEFVHRLLRDHFALRDLVALLYDERREARMDVVQRLAAQGESSFDVLAGLINHPTVSVRESAVMGLGRLPTSRVAPLLGDLLVKEREPSVRRQIVESLRKLPWSEVKEVAERAFQEKDPGVRAEAINLTAWKGPECHGLLRRALTDASPVVFRALLAHVPDTFFQGEEQEDLSIRLSLRPYLTDVDPGVRAGALRLVGRVEGEAALPFLLEACWDTDSDRRVRKAAASSLGWIRALASRSPQLRRPAWWLAVEESLVRLLRDPDSDVRKEAAGALKYPVEPGTASVLIETLADPWISVREAAADTLANFPELADLDPEPWVKLLRSHDANLQSAAVRALGGPRPASIQPVLFAWLRGRRSRLQTAAIGALGEMRVKEAVPDLLRLVFPGDGRRLWHQCLSILDLEPVDQRISATKALGAIGGEAAVSGLREVLRREDSPYGLKYDAFRALEELERLGDSEAGTFLRKVRSIVKEEDLIASHPHWARSTIEGAVIYGRIQAASKVDL